ncbi:protein Red [Culicoides brevitarsis]|uniref:protein Red n=1 Tax=Culicoides brevitarsis TaxID=469753 RepID=UPI00307C4977
MEEPATVRLTNDDFRKLMMTPRAPPPGSSTATSSLSGGVVKSGSKSSSAKRTERHDARKKKKNFYAQLKKQEDSKLQELSEKYRDRARERRDGANPDYQAPDPTSTGAYRAVAPDLKSIHDAAERRRQLIQESKFLGGDMEHTHLVKGLDYALLQKVRSEIVTKEQMEEEEMERLANEEKEAEPEKEEIIEENGEIKFKTIIGKNIHRIVQMQRSRVVERNELFAIGRMAYLIELDDENADTDIPTTIIRSKAEIPQEAQQMQTLSTNDIVINKLSQILSYLRQGGKGKKNKKRDKDKPLFKMPLDKHNDDESIYGDIGDYKASKSSSSSSSRHHSSSSRSEKDKPRSYFSNYRGADDEREKEKEIVVPPPPKFAASSILNKLQSEPEGYAECYPGLQEMNDAIDDSDDEVDYTKMDIGNKKGPIGRWDFDTQEEYSDYMSKKEALPKAAFQYGVKMQDGRKTRKHKTEKSEKAELDREWQKIQNIIHKRKAGGSAGGEPSSKMKHY